MTMNQSGRPTRNGRWHGLRRVDATRQPRLLQAEPLIFEIGSADRPALICRKAQRPKNRLGGVARSAPIGLPGLSEPEAVRHYVRLSARRTTPSTLACSRWARAR
jgi:glycine dehydrogenase subunit 2